MKNSWKETFKLLLSWKMLAMLALGFSSGFPFYIVKDVLKAWLTDANIDIKTIGIFSAVATPYTLKFIWSPVMDSYTPSFLGRRRGWMLITQLFLLVTIACLGFFNPGDHIQMIGVVAVAISFFGASQDIALDAFRREYLTDDELGFGTGVWMNAWRLGAYISVGAAFLASDYGVSYKSIYFMLSLVMAVGLVTTLLVPEPKVELPPPASIKESVIGPFVEFFKRNGAWMILLFILFYKIGDSMAGALNVPFILKMNYSKIEYFAIVKGIGMFGIFGGVLIGGSIMARLGINKSLWIFGVLQSISTAGFATIVMFDHTDPSWQDIRLPLLSCVVGFEFLATGMGQAAYASYMALQTNKRFTATQYALLTSLMAVPGTIAAAITGYIQSSLGWAGFYIACALFALPGMFLLVKLAPWKDNTLPKNA